MSLFSLYTLFLLPYPRLGIDLFKYHVDIALQQLDFIQYAWYSYENMPQENETTNCVLFPGDTLLRIHLVKEPGWAKFDIVLADLNTKTLPDNGIYLGQFEPHDHFCQMVNHLYQYFKHLAWYEERSSFLALIQATEPFFDPSNHIQHYLFDALVSREICTYIDEAPMHPGDALTDLFMNQIL